MESPTKVFVSKKYIANDSNFIISLSPFVFWLLQGLLIFLLHCIRNSEVSFSNKLFLEVTGKLPINPFEPCFSELIFLFFAQFDE